jgi:tRNA nucleotidyltransferase (CCA-adding enzyme)
MTLLYRLSLCPKLNVTHHATMDTVIYSCLQHCGSRWEGGKIANRRALPENAMMDQTPNSFNPAVVLNLAERCQTHLSSSLQRILLTATRTAGAHSMCVYAVGGFVRDVLLGVSNEDVDLTVEGDGVAFARHLAAAIDGTWKGPSAFGTAVVIAHDCHKIDVATARRETYKQPAALPTVIPGSLRDDLFRRDFSINTLAFALNGPEAFNLVDWYGGSADLAEGVIRVLHNRSFRDDPTRLFRAIRLEQRFGFVLHRHTLRLLHRAVDKRWIELLSGARLWRELRLMLEGESPVACLRRLDELQILPHIDAALALSPVQLDLLTDVTEARLELAETHPEVVGRAWQLYLATLLYGMEADLIRRIGTRLALAPRTIQELIGGMAAVDGARHRLYEEGGVRPSTVVTALRTLPLELLPLLLALAPGSDMRQIVQAYLTTWRHIRPGLTGDDLKRLGVPQGPQIGRLLARILAAKLDGEAPTLEAEESLVRSAVRQMQDA